MNKFVKGSNMHYYSTQYRDYYIAYNHGGMSGDPEHQPKFKKSYGKVSKENKVKFEVKRNKYYPDGSGRDYLISQTLLDNRQKPNPEFVRN